MNLTDWFNFIVAIGTVALAVVASLYLHYKAKIDTKTAAGKAFDTIGKLAVWAVNEAEFSGMRSVNTPLRLSPNSSSVRGLLALPNQLFTGQSKPLGRPQTSTTGKLPRLKKSPQRAQTRLLAIQQVAWLWTTHRWR